MTAENVALRERVQKQARDGLAEHFIAEVNDGRWDAVSYDLASGLFAQPLMHVLCLKLTSGLILLRPQDGVDRTELAGSGASQPKPELQAGQVVVYPALNQLHISGLPVDASRVKLEEVRALRLPAAELSSA